MRCRVGNWKTGVGISVDRELFDELRKVGRGLTVSLLPSRRLLLTPSPSGGGGVGRLDFHGSGGHERMHKSPDFLADGEFKLDIGQCPPDTRLPLFELHEVAIDYDYAMDGWLTDPLAADHKLPWPRRRNGLRVLTAEELRHQCYLRCLSHMLEGGFGSFDEVGVPAEVVRMMAGGFVLARNKARAEVDAIAARAA